MPIIFSHHPFEHGLIAYIFTNEPLWTNRGRVLSLLKETAYRNILTQRGKRFFSRRLLEKCGLMSLYIKKSAMQWMISHGFLVTLQRK